MFESTRLCDLCPYSSPPVGACSANTLPAHFHHLSNIVIYEKELCALKKGRYRYICKARYIYMYLVRHVDDKYIYIYINIIIIYMYIYILIQ